MAVVNQLGFHAIENTSFDRKYGPKPSCPPAIVKATLTIVATPVHNPRYQGRRILIPPETTCYCELAQLRNPATPDIPLIKIIEDRKN
jgi:hypothetical protein